ncbi:hypothetical protein D3C72_1133370 [compost metagenome]
MHVVGKYGSAALFGCGGFQLFLQVVAVEDVVAQHQRTGIWTNELFTQNKGLCQPVRTWLHLVLQIQAPLTAITQQLLKTGGILRGANDQNIANTRQHQGTERIVDHRLVIDGQQLLAHRHGNRIETSA